MTNNNEILIPVRCRYDIPSLNHMNMPSYKKGDIFMFNPFHEIHVILEESGNFEEIDNNECDFICAFDMVLNGTEYKMNDIITEEDIKTIDENVIRDMCFIGRINKVLKNQEDIQQPITIPKQEPKTQSIPFTSYAIIAKELKIDKKEFKKRCEKELGIIIPDMRKKCPKNQIQLIKDKLAQ